MAPNNELVRILLFLGALLLVVPLLVMIVVWPMGMWGGGHMWNGGMWDGTGATWGWLLMWIVLLVILLGGGYLLYRAVSRPGANQHDAALEELRLAYARGELSDEEFEVRRDRLISEATGA